MERSRAAEESILDHRTLRKGLLLLLPVVSALCMIVSFPIFDLGFLAWFGLAPLLFALRQRGRLAASSLAFLYGCLYCFGAFSWFHNVISLSHFLIMLFLFSLYFAAFGILYRLISMGIGSWIILGAPAIWVALEYMRSNLFFLSWPWNLLGHTQYQYLCVIQIADITGVYGISFLIVMVNQFLSQLPDLFVMRRGATASNPTRRAQGINWTTHTLTMTLTLAVTFSYGWYKLAQPGGGEHLRVALVQANVLTRDKMSLDDQVGHLRRYSQLTRDAARSHPDLIVWPASSLPAPIRASRLVRFTIRRLARETGSYLLVGGTGYGKLQSRNERYPSYSNTEYLIAPAGHLVGEYNKIRLIPFDEYLPLQGKINWPTWITTLQESSKFGDGYTLFEASGAKFSTPICWENMFPDFFRRFVKDGAEFMISVTNEGFMGRSAGPYQSLAMNAFRAVENRVAIARAVPTGVSAFINPDGKIVERVQDSNGIDLFVSGVLVRDVPLSNKNTFYTVHGDLFTYTVISIGTLIIIATLIAQKWSPSHLRK